LAGRLEALAVLELIEPVRDPRSPLRGGFRFVQELVCEVARNRMSREVRRLRHVAAAHYLESLGGPDNAVVAADHYLSALSVTPPGAEADALRGQTTDVLLSALDRAAALYANEEVISLGSKIVDLELDLPSGRLVAIYERMAAAASALLRSDEAQTHVEHAMALSRRRGDEAGLRHTAALAAEIYLDLHETDRALQVLEEHLDGVDDLSAEPELAGLGAQLARARGQSGDDEAALTAAERALIAAEEFRLTPVILDALVTKAGVLGLQGRILESRFLYESVIEVAEREDLPRIAIAAYNDISALLEEDLTGDPTLAAIELGRRIGDALSVLTPTVNRAEMMVMRGRWDEAEALLTDPLWESATGMPLYADKLYLLAMKDAFRGQTGDAEVALRAALASPADGLGAGLLTIRGEEAALVRVLIGEAAAALDWAQGVLLHPDSILWLEPLVIVLLLAGSPRHLEDLAAAVFVRSQAFDRHHRRFVRALVAVRVDDTASLAGAEALIADVASRGYTGYELIWTIGLARWLPEGDGDRVRLMAGARERINGSGFGGLARFLDP
jgi:tetratricopeptide (TPR) repeat protein